MLACLVSICLAKAWKTLLIRLLTALLFRRNGAENVQKHAWMLNTRVILARLALLSLA
jgi:hypothetical protein